MKLSTSILAHKLKSKFTLQNKKALSDELHLEQVLFFCDGDGMQNHKIYICSQEQVSEQDLIVPEEAVLFCIGKVRTRNTGRNGQVFQLVGNVAHIAPPEAAACARTEAKEYSQPQKF